MASTVHTVYRCEYCHHPVIDSDIQQGGCVCGSRRLKVATSITHEELEKLKARGYEYRPEDWMTEDEAEALRVAENAGAQ